MNNIIFNLIIKSMQLTEVYLFVYLFIYLFIHLWRKEGKKKSKNNELLLLFIYLFYFCNRLAITVSNQFYYIFNYGIQIYFNCSLRLFNYNPNIFSFTCL